MLDRKCIPIWRSSLHAFGLSQREPGYNGFGNPSAR
jgi:hypothetical protein